MDAFVFWSSLGVAVALGAAGLAVGVAALRRDPSEEALEVCEERCQAAERKCAAVLMECSELLERMNRVQARVVTEKKHIAKLRKQVGIENPGDPDSANGEAPDGFAPGDLEAMQRMLAGADLRA